MNSNCLDCSALFNERSKSFGRNFLYTVLAFTVLCLVSYVINK